MFRHWFRRRANRPILERLRGEIVAAARQPALYAAFGAADTFDGRFELLALYSSLVVARLTALPAPGPDLAQELTDALFVGLDDDLREMGVGDLAVPKRVKKLAAALLGRRKAYLDALDRPDDQALREALSRNVLGAAIGPGDPRVAGLARHVRDVVAALSKASVSDFVAGPLVLPAATPDC
jgi:cytochrome b pre-mRNA-processing protein 3